MSWTPYAGPAEFGASIPALGGNYIWVMGEFEGGGTYITCMGTQPTNGSAGSNTNYGTDGGSPPYVVYDPITASVYGTFSTIYPQEQLFSSPVSAPSGTFHTVGVGPRTDMPSYCIMVNPVGGVPQMAVLAWYYSTYAPYISVGNPASFSPTPVALGSTIGQYAAAPVFDGTYIWIVINYSGSYVMAQIDPVAKTIVSTTALPYTPQGIETGFDGRYVYVGSASGVMVFDTTTLTTSTHGSTSVGACWYSPNLSAVVTCDEIATGSTYNVYTMPAGGGSLASIGDTSTIVGHGDTNMAVVGFCDGPNKDLWMTCYNGSGGGLWTCQYVAGGMIQQLL